MARTAGLTDDLNTEPVIDAWGAVMKQVSDRLGRHVSVLRIDSIVWQAGQAIGPHEDDQEAAREALLDHLEHVGVDDQPAADLAGELTAAIGDGDTA